MSIGCCDRTTFDVSISSDLLLIGDYVQTDNAKPTPAMAYSRGDLLTISDDNVAKLAADPAYWDVICALNYTAEQSTAAADGGIEIAVFKTGEFDVSQIKLGGVNLTTAQYDAARRRANHLNVELRKVV